MNFRELVREQKVISHLPERWDPDGNWQRLVLPLTIQGVGVRGLRLRVRIPNTVDGFGTLLQLEQSEGSTVTNLERIEWKVGHQNPNFGPERVRLTYLSSTHYHAYDLNLTEDEPPKLRHNIPLAEPIEPDPATVSDLFSVAGKLMNIANLHSITRPPFQSEMF
ncbi:MAG: hypothetical protein AAGF30_11245 [Pseudomonadota bacterium]